MCISRRPSESNSNKPKITLDLPMSVILSKWPETISVLMEYKMSCIGCYLSSFDSLEVAVTVHGLLKEELLDALNQRVDEANTNNIE